MSRNAGLVTILVACGIAALAFNLIAFSLPVVRPMLFWTCYTFVCIGIVGVAAANAYVFMRSRNALEALYSTSVVAISIAYLAIAVALSLLCMTLLVIPTWLAFAVHVALLAACLIGCIAGGAGARMVAEGDAKTSQQTSAMKTLRMQAELAMAGVTDPAAKAAMARLADDLRYSDPVSSPATQYLDDALMGQMSQLGQVAHAGDANAIQALCAQMQQTLAQRNALCRKAK